MNKSQLTSKLKLINLQDLVFEVVETITKGEQISFVNEDTKLYERVQHEIEQEVKKRLLEKEKIDEENIINNFKANDKEYNRLLSLSNSWEAKLENQKKQAIEEFKQQEDYKNLKAKADKFVELNKEKELFENKLNLAKIEAINDFKNKDEYKELIKDRNELQTTKTDLEKLKANQKNIEYEAIDNFKKGKEYLDLLEKKEKDQKELEDRLSKIKDLENEITNINQKYKQEIEKINEEAQKALEDYKSRRFYSSTKRGGEEFEDWIMAEFNQHYSFDETLQFTKATKVLGEHNGKPDFELKIYDSIESKEKNKEPLLSVIFEAKTQDQNTDGEKQKNKTFFKKLNKDREAYGAEIAVLITELEPDNDFIFQKVLDQKNMYMVRPNHFCGLVDVFKYIAKFKQITNEASLELKNKKEFITNLEEAKNNFLKKLVEDINKHAGEIDAEAEKIAKSAQKIRELSATKIKNKLSTAENKFIELIRVVKRSSKKDDEKATQALYNSPEAVSASPVDDFKDAEANEDDQE